MTFTMTDLTQIIGYLVAGAGAYMLLQRQIADNRVEVARLKAQVESHGDMFEKIERSLERIERKLDGKADKERHPA
jgi:hypothetical protein